MEKQYPISGDAPGPRRDEDADPAPCSPLTPDARDEHWIAAFTSQVADAGRRRRAINYARGRVRTIEQSGGLVTSSDPEDLVDDAIADTWRGVLSWKPEDASLLDHVMFAVRSRTRHDRDRAKKYPAVSLDAHEGEEDERAAALLNEAEEALAASAPATNAGEMLFAIEVFERVRVLAAGDFDVLALLDAMREGVTDRAGLMEATGMSARRYERTRRRLDTLVLELPASASHVRTAGPYASERCAA